MTTLSSTAGKTELGTEVEEESQIPQALLDEFRCDTPSPWLVANALGRTPLITPPCPVQVLLARADRGAADCRAGCVSCVGGAASAGVAAAGGGGAGRARPVQRVVAAVHAHACRRVHIQPGVPTPGPHRPPENVRGTPPSRNSPLSPNPRPWALYIEWGAQGARMRPKCLH